MTLSPTYIQVDNGNKKTYNSENVNMQTNRLVVYNTVDLSVHRKNLGQATGFATLLHLLLSLDYFIHERIWLHIKWSKI